jgi:A/G-specific adenine glycosylase
VERELLDWHRLARRDLPWRRTRDPYLVLVSEVMLQQTQAARVVPFWEGWVRRWPTAPALAAARRSEVIREWQGLGYNRRAVALHEAARVVASSGWPEDLTVLPGVGPYTADAVARFAFGRQVLPVDVNVRRVLRRSGGAFSPRSAEALMDLGATVCLARVPRCAACPLAFGCPSRGARFEAERRQSPFRGSARERRAALLRAVALADGPLPARSLDPVALRSLVRDGLVAHDDGWVGLPD